MKRIEIKAVYVIPLIFLFLSASAGWGAKAHKDTVEGACIIAEKVVADSSEVHESTVEAARLQVHTTVTLKDGSRLLGNCLLKNLKMTTVFGEVTIPLKAVESLEVENDGERVKLVTHAGDVLHGSPDLSGLKVATLIGPQNIELRHLKRAEFKVPYSEGLGAFLIQGKTRGGLRTEFLKEVPEELAARFERVVRRADTMNSVVSRHNSARWLYPVSGKGEAPRVLLEDGQKLYPIWGTWRQRWHTGWEWFDENGSWIRGVKDRTTPHFESIVEYLVVPHLHNGN